MAKKRGAAAGPAAARDYASLVASLSERRGTLSKRLQQVAQFVLNHPEDVAITNIVGLAKMADVPVTTITRFAKELGYSGFSDLQDVFRQRLLGPRMSYAARLKALAADHGRRDDLNLEDPSLVFDTFVQAAMDSLLRLREAADRQELEGFVDVLGQSAAVHIAAARGAYGVGVYSYYGLSQVGKRSHMIDNAGAMRAEQIAAIGNEDVLLVMTFDDYTPETIEIARLVHEKGRRILVITDNELSPVANLGEHTLYVKEARYGHFRSQVPAMVLCQSVIVSLGRQIDRRG